MARSTGRTGTKLKVPTSNRQILPYTIGPWPKGLNNREADYGFRDIDPQELITCSNLDVHESGILVNRPGFVNYDPGIFPAIINDNVGALSFRSVIGSAKLDNAYEEALIQIYDTTNKNIYLVRTSVNGGGELTDFPGGFWAKQTPAGGSDYWLTSIVRYDKDLYLTTNNAYLNEASAFTGGFYFGYNSTPTVKTVFKTFTQSMYAMNIDSADNIYLLVDQTTILKIAPDGTETTITTGLTNQYFMCCDGTNLYTCGEDAAGDYYAGPILKITPAGVITTLLAGVANDKYYALYFDAITNEIVFGHLVNGSYFNMDAINITTHSVRNIMSSPAADGNNQVFNIARATSGSGFYAIHASGYGIQAVSPSGLVFAPASAVPPSLLPLERYMIEDTSQTTNDGLFVADGLATTGGIWRVNVQAQTSVEYVSGLDNPVSLVIDSTGDMFVYEYGQNRIIKAAASSIPTLNQIASMPFGDESFMFKDRMWIIDKLNNTLHYSKATDPTDWNTADDAGYFIVNPGDGYIINDVVVSNNQMFIFKENSTWRFTFTSDPGVDGTLAVLSQDRGAYSACVYNNVPYLVGKQGVQKLLNGYFIDQSLQIKDFHKFFSPYSIINTIDHKLYVTLQAVNDTDPHILTMNLLSGAWSTYNLADLFPATQFPVGSHLYRCGQDCAVFLAQSGSTAVVGAINNIASDNVVTATLTTRNLPVLDVKTRYYDFQTPLSWKKLTRVSVDILSTFFDYESTDTPYPIVLGLGFLSPAQGDIALMAMNEKSSSPLLGPDDFQVGQPLYDSRTAQFFTAHRFQVINFSINAQLATALTSPGNNMEFAVKRISGFITQKTSKGDDAYIGS